MNKYCTYLTIYDGNRLPKFYIGYSTVSKVNNGYHGTVTSKKYKTIWNEEIRLSPHLFRTRIITTHETIHEAQAKEVALQSAQNVAKNPLFINSHVQGSGFCVDRNGVLHTEKTKDKMRKSRQGRSPVPKGSKLTEDHKRKIGLSQKGRVISSETIAKRIETRTGKKNSKPFSAESNARRSETLRARMTPEIKKQYSERSQGEKNAFYGKNHTAETRKRMSEVDRSYLVGLFWWTDGVANLRSREQPGSEWRRGRTVKR